MNAKIQAITAALTITTDDGQEQLHRLLVNRSQKLRQTLDKITSTVDDRESKYTRIKELREEMDNAMANLLSDDSTDEHRSVTVIASELKRVNDSIDKEIDKVYDLISEANALRSEVTELTQKIADIPLVATAA